jgi:endonuclease/exonuclease/phosphatase family metal-dependent hydrolase
LLQSAFVVHLLMFRSHQILRAAAGLAGLVVLLETCGCASRRPAPIVVSHQLVAAPTGKAEQEDLNLKLVTYNIWGLPSWMTGARTERYLKIARELERLDADFILLQEAWTAEARSAIPRDGQWAIACAAAQRSFFQQSGLVTLSKFPILGGQFYPFTRAAFPDRFVNKGVLKITVQLPDGGLLNVWNVHLQDAGAVRTRASQVRELVARVESAEDGQIADLVAGDFNCIPDSSLYRELAGSLGVNLQEFTGAKPFVTWDRLSAKPGAGQTLDYIFLRPRTRLQIHQADTQVTFTASSLKQRLSDHLGLETTVSLTCGASLAEAAGFEFESHRRGAVLARRIDSGKH